MIKRRLSELGRFLRGLLRTDVSRRERLLGLFCGCAIGIVLALFYLWDSTPQLIVSDTRDFRGLVANLDSSIRNQFFIGQRNVNQLKSSQVREMAEQLVVIEIDDASLRQLDMAWPLKRSVYKDIVERLKASGARTIGLDILFNFKSQFPEQDAVLAEVLADPALVPCYALDQSGLPLPPAPALLARTTEEEYVKRGGFVLEVVGRNGNVEDALLMLHDTDAARTYWAWDVQLLAHFQGRSPTDVLKDTYHLTDRFDLGPINQAGFAPINYLGSFRRVNDPMSSVSTEVGEGQIVTETISETPDEGSLSQALNVITLSDLMTYPPEMLEGGLLGVETDAQGNPVLDAAGNPKKLPFIALVGVTASAGFEVRDTPLGNMSGLEVHVNILGNLMLDSFLRWDAIGWLWVLLAGALVGLMVPNVRYQAALGLSVVGLVALLGLQWGLNEMAQLSDSKPINLQFPLTYVLLSLTLSWIALEVFLTFSQQARIHKFQQVIRELCPVADMEQILKDNGLKVGGQERELTMMFSDLRGFTSMAEKMGAVEVLDRVNEYFEVAGPIFRQYGGCVFDYQGDAQMVVFGLQPESRENHAAAACKAGAALIWKLELKRKEWLSEGRPMPETGIGICTGPVAFGYVGSSVHKQLAAIGDPTNTAARMQGKSKELDAPVLITESTYLQAEKDAQVEMEFLEEIEVKGKREPLKVYGVRIDETAEKIGLVEPPAAAAQATKAGT